MHMHYERLKWIIYLAIRPCDVNAGIWALVCVVATGCVAYELLVLAIITQDYFSGIGEWSRLIIKEAIFRRAFFIIDI